ncbi:hypothetical protein SESBI_23141 [Sesbania bispinosa]|nr:hypothetical protein SESBI_23141 [Sesbania bispinosa]
MQTHHKGHIDSHKVIRIGSDGGVIHKWRIFPHTFLCKVQDVADGKEEDIHQWQRRCT